MYKIIGFILVIISDVLIVWYIRDVKTAQTDSLFDLIDFIKKISIKVIDLKIPIAEAVLKTKGEVSQYIDEIIEKFQKCRTNSLVRDSLIDIIKKDDKLDNDCKKIIVDYLNVFGKIPKENMEDYLKMTINSLDKILLIKKESHARTKKIVNSIVYGVSFVLIILII
jgi:stage III sporulation protein AB